MDKEVHSVHQVAIPTPLRALSRIERIARTSKKGAFAQDFGAV
jgi:hypothetical protein